MIKATDDLNHFSSHILILQRKGLKLWSVRTRVSKVERLGQLSVVHGGAGFLRRSLVATVQHGLSPPRHLNSTLGLAGSAKQLLLATCKVVNPVPMATVCPAVFGASVTDAESARIWHSNAKKPTNRRSLSTSSRDSLEASATASSCRSASAKSRHPCSASSR